MSRMSRDKGRRIEQALVNLHRDLGVHAERVPLSGAQRYQGNGADIDVYALGRDAAPLVGEMKARASGEGFATLERWLGENDVLFLRRDRAEPVVVLPWRIWARLLGAVEKSPPRAAGARFLAAASARATPADAPANSAPSLLPAIGDAEPAHDPEADSFGSWRDGVAELRCRHRRAVARDEGGAEITLALYAPGGAIGEVALDARRAIALAGELISAAQFRFGLGE